MVNISNLDWNKVAVLQCEAESVVKTITTRVYVLFLSCYAGCSFESANTVAKARAPANLLSFASREWRLTDDIEQLLTKRAMLTYVSFLMVL